VPRCPRRVGSRHRAVDRVFALATTPFSTTWHHNNCIQGLYYKAAERVPAKQSN